MRREIFDKLTPVTQPFSASLLTALLDDILAVAYVTDMETHEILFMNRALQQVHGNAIGLKCWQVFQQLDEPCAFCTNSRLLTPDGTVAPTYTWEHRNPVTGRWYALHDQAIPWHDGRLVRLEIGIDITGQRQQSIAATGSSRILQTVTHTTERLVGSGDWQRLAPPLLQQLGVAAAADRVYLYKYVPSKDGSSACTKCFDWNMPGAPSRPTVLAFEKGPETSFVYAAGQTREIPESIRPLITDAPSVLALLPVRVAGRDWGFLGLDALHSQRRWTAVEINALQSTANVLGTLIQRSQMLETDGEGEARRRLAGDEQGCMGNGKTVCPKNCRPSNTAAGEACRLQEIEALLEAQKARHSQLTAELEKLRAELEERDITVKCLLAEFAKNREEIEESMLANVRLLILPYLDDLEAGLEKAQNLQFITLIRNNLQTVTSSFAKQISIADHQLTQREMRIADFIRQGRTSKEIAQFLGIATRTVETYRNKIRKKLSIRNKNINLRTYLQNIMGPR